MLDKEGRFLGCVALAIGLIVSVTVATRSFERIKTDKAIEVTGSAKRRIQSDLIVWTGQVAMRSADLKSAYRSLAAAMPQVLAFLDKKGIPRNEIVVSAVTTTTLHPRDKEGREIEETITGYELSQSVEVRSAQVGKVAQAAREVTELIEHGIALDSQAPKYHYTKLADLKIQMLAEAAKDSRVRAEQIASSTGSKIGPLRQARMGVIQINPADSTDVSSEGNNDTSSFEKDIITVVASTFALE